LALDEAASWPGEPAVFALAHIVQGILQMAQHMKLVVDDQSLGSMTLLESGVAERLPHVHDGKPYFAGFLGAKPGVELVHACLGTALAAEPNGPAADQVADHDAVAVRAGGRCKRGGHSRRIWPTEEGDLGRTQSLGRLRFGTAESAPLSSAQSTLPASRWQS